MAVNVTVAALVFTDRRYTRLGRLLGTNSRFDAIGRMVHVWEHCLEHQTYVVTADALDDIAGPGFALAMVGAELGEETPEGIRVCGTEGRIEWLGRLRANASRGGVAKAKSKRSNKKVPKGMPSGLPVGMPAGVPDACPLTLTLTSSISKEEEGARSSAGVSDVTRIKVRLLELHPTHSWAAREAGMASTLLRFAGGAVDEVLARLGLLFSPACPQWLAKGRDLGTLVQHWNKLAPPLKPRTAPEPTYTPPPAIPAEEAQEAVSEAMVKLRAKFGQGGE